MSRWLVKFASHVSASSLTSAAGVNVNHTERSRPWRRPSSSAATSGEGSSASSVASTVVPETVAGAGPIVAAAPGRSLTGAAAPAVAAGAGTAGGGRGGGGAGRLEVTAGPNRPADL